MSELYEKLARAGFLRFGEIKKSKIASTPVASLIDFAAEIAEDTSGAQLGRERSVFAQSASLSLGGGRQYCSNLDCRKERISELAQFALLYCDRVYISNFLTDHIPHPGGTAWEDEDEFHQEFTNDLIILNEIRPLVEKGIIVPFTPPLNYCPHCLAAHSLGHDADARLKALEKHLRQRFAQELTACELFKFNEGYFVGLRGPETLLDHGGQGFSYRVLPEPLRDMPRLMHKVNAGEVVSLSKSVRRKLGYHQRLAGRVLRNVAFELTAAQSLNTSFLTERPLHIEALAMLSESDRIQRRNLTALRHLTSFVPFLDGVPLKSLMRLREKEEEAFVLYRQALNEAIDEYKKQEELTARDAQALYSDVIAPKLAMLDSKVKSAKKKLLKDAGLNIFAWVGAISFGIYAGFVPSNLITAAEALGLTKVVAELIKLTLDGTDVTEDIRREDMYFLWQVRRAAKK